MALDLNLSWQGNTFDQYHVTIVSQSCHFGNVRWWLKCPECGRQVFDLKVEGVGYSTTNPKMKPYVAKIEKAKADILSGKIVVPSKPAA